MGQWQPRPLTSGPASTTQQDQLATATATARRRQLTLLMLTPDFHNNPPISQMRRLGRSVLK